MPDGVCVDPAGFSAAIGGSLLVERFQTVPTSARSLADTTAPLLTLRTTTTTIGLRDVPDGFGGAASDGQVRLQAPVPEPGQWALLAMGLAALAAWRRPRRQAR